MLGTTSIASLGHHHHHHHHRCGHGYHSPASFPSSAPAPSSSFARHRSALSSLSWPTSHALSSSAFVPLALTFATSNRKSKKARKGSLSFAITAQHGVLPAALLHGVRDALQQVPPTWTSSLVSTSIIFVLGFPLLRSGLTSPGIASAFALGTFTWRAFGFPAFLLVMFYFLTGTLVTKIKINQKEREGIAEKRRGKRGPSSVWGSGSAGMLCAIAAISGLGGPTSSYLWQLGFVASFATKLSDTVSSEIGKAFGKTTYLVTTFKMVPRGTEGAISIEGTLAGLSASTVFSALAYFVHEINSQEVVVCVVSSQIANIFESYIGAKIQDKPGFEWLNNDVVNILNISLGAALALISSYVLNVL